MTRSPTVLSLALALACAGTAAGASARVLDDGGHRLSCNVSSRYSVRPAGRAFVFRQDEDKREIGIGGGRLFIDGHEVTVSDADHARLRRMEGEMHALVPELQQVATEALDIAFTALTEVARELSADPGQTVANLETSHRRAMARMRNTPMVLFDRDAMADVVQPILRDYLPEIIGGAVRTAIKAAFTIGKDGDLQARMDRMEHELDTRVDARAKALEPLAEQMCSRLRRIDALDDSLDVRLPDGRALDLLRADTRSDRHRGHDGDARDGDGHDGDARDGDDSDGGDKDDDASGARSKAS
jgi:hypothetical protein